MRVNSLLVNITSEQPERLIAFYRDVVGLEPRPEFGDGALDAGGAILAFDGHSETKGKAKEPSRVLINLRVGDAKAERERIEAAGVQFIRKEGREYWGGIISTLVDPDGNYCQLVEYHTE